MEEMKAVRFIMNPLMMRCRSRGAVNELISLTKSAYEQGISLYEAHL
jgi:hypothetical protein